jgi:hypothetical protein
MHLSEVALLASMAKHRGHFFRTANHSTRGDLSFPGA